MKKTFEKTWIAKRCIEVSNVVHVVTKASKPLLKIAYTLVANERMNHHTLRLFVEMIIGEYTFYG
jgi:hypothetical protein